MYTMDAQYEFLSQGLEDVELEAFRDHVSSHVLGNLENGYNNVKKLMSFYFGDEGSKDKFRLTEVRERLGETRLCTIIDGLVDQYFVAEEHFSRMEVVYKELKEINKLDRITKKHVQSAAQRLSDDGAYQDLTSLANLFGDDYSKAIREGMQAGLKKTGTEKVPDMKPQVWEPINKRITFLQRFL